MGPLLGETSLDSINNYNDNTLIIINKVTKKVKQEPGLVIDSDDINSSKTNDYSK